MVGEILGAVIDDEAVYRMARWLNFRDRAWKDWVNDEFIPTEAQRSEAMHALQHALAESIGPDVTIRIDP